MRLGTPLSDSAAPQIAHHVVDEHGFEDTDKFYFRFYSDEAVKPDTRSSAADLEDSLSALLAPSNATDYRVVVVTGSESRSGTDSCVYLRLVGDGGDSGEVELSKSDNFNKFEKGQTDTFSIQSRVALRSVQKVIVRIDPSGIAFKKNWLLKSVEVSGGDLSGPVEFQHGSTLTPEKPMVELVLPDSEAAGTAPDVSSVSMGLKKTISKKASQRLGKSAQISGKSVFGPSIRSLLPAVNEVPTCYFFNSRSGCLVVGQSHARVLCFVRIDSLRVQN